VDSLGGISSLEEFTFSNAPSRARRLPRAGDTIVSTVRTYLRAISYVEADDASLVCSTGFAVITAGKRLHPRYLAYWMRSDPVVDEICARSTGVSYPAINASEIGCLPVPLLPIERQREVADFLDRKTAAIDALIAKKERLVDLLQEKRQALITQAVTKGRNLNVTMTDSGIPWIGNVPSNWKIMAVKRTATPGRKTFTDGDWIESPFITEEGVRLIQTGNVGIGRYKEQGFRYVSEQTFHDLRCTEVDPGDVLICRLDGPVGRACLAPNLGVRMITSVDNAILKPRPDCDGRYLVYVLSSPKYLDWVQVLCRVGGGFRFRVSRSMLGDIQIPVPPGDEQRRIADLLDEQTQRSLAVEARLEAHCHKLREYRRALITATVTGRIDVSKEAA
jgi:type I restriction enzyme S subunit